MNGTCEVSPSVIKLKEIAELICYHIITPIYFFIGLFGNLTLLVAFQRQSKTDGAYAYQVFLTISKTCEIIAFSAFTVTFKLAAAAAQIDDHGGVKWFKRNYYLMFYVAHIVCVGLNVFVTSSLFCSVAMTADRVFALAKPYVYKSINRKRHQLIAALCCFGFSLLLNVYDAWSWVVVELPGALGNESDGYVIRANPDFIGTSLSMGLANFRTAIRLICVVALIGLNVSMALLYRKQFHKVNHTDRKEQEMKRTEKTLLMLTIYQSLLTTTSQVPHCAYYVAQFASVEFTRCWGAVLAPFVDGCIQICDAIDFFIIITMNQRMRRSVLGVFTRCSQGGVQTTIA